MYVCSTLMYTNVRSNVQSSDLMYMNVHHKVGKTKGSSTSVNEPFVFILSTVLFP